jgi:hypothetical protein
MDDHLVQLQEFDWLFRVRNVREILSFTPEKPSFGMII